MATEVFGPNHWRQELANRRDDFRNFYIPKVVFDHCGVVWNSKRQVEIQLSTGERFEGFCSITSGPEIYIPTHLRPLVRAAEWFECIIVGDETSDEATLDLMPSAQFPI